MKTPPELLKNFANRVAQVALSTDGNQAIRLLRQTGLLAPVSNAPAPLWHGFGADLQGQGSPTGPAGLEKVGIWERKIEDGQTYFVRSKETVRDWGLWANLGRIGPKKANKRVVFIGESVARGFLYDPLFTPVMALESILHARMGKDEVEIVDLARTNLGFEVGDLAMSALLLEPDLVIVFSGNNWDKSAPKSSDVPSVDTVLREQGIPGMKNLVEGELAEHVANLVKHVSSIYEQRGIPLVWIIPEFNLGDWRDQATNAPHLIEDHNQRWIVLREEAEQAFGDGDYTKAASFATKMVELDHASTVTPLYILADCCKHLGDIEGRRRYLEMARDAVIWDTSKNAAPRTYSATEKTLRAEIPRYANRLVDLPILFKEYLQGGVPDRRLFVDYCHLSSEGIQVAMAAAASVVLQVFTGQEVPWRSLMDQCVLPGPEVESETFFLAAVHNAHWWQTAELVQHYCLRAVEASPGIGRIMTSYMDLQTRRSPMLMCRATEQLAEVGSPLMQHYLLRFNYQRLDTVLLDGVASALKKIGIDSLEQRDRLRLEEHSVVTHDTNLLDYYYCTEGLQQQEIMWIVPHLADYLSHKANNYYKAYWRESRFVFVGEANHSVRLRLTCRLPHDTIASNSICLRINDVSIGRTSIGSEWETWDIDVPGTLVHDGVNKITVEWPTPVFTGIQKLESVALDLMDKMYPEFFCVFGEIHSFIASGGEKAGNRASHAESELDMVAVG
ncbi:MAG TPA: hypothetical protein VG759_10015 [Candidatus Angelobacter sp.]|jgi:hypothetical protein|nr:hypothetical protein [Candidatus Angelobacter sp.]